MEGFDDDNTDNKNAAVRVSLARFLVLRAVYEWSKPPPPPANT